MDYYKDFAQEVEQKEWYTQAGEGKMVYLSTPLLTCIAMKEIYEINYRIVIGYTFQAYADWFFDRLSMEKVGDFFLSKFKKNKNLLEEIKDMWNRDYLYFVTLTEKLSLINLEKKGVEDLLEIFKDLTKRGEKKWQHFIFIDGFDINGEQIIKKEIEKENKRMADKIGSLTFPLEMSYVQQEKVDFLKIARMVDNHNLRDHFLKTTTFTDCVDQVEDAINEHQQKYYWYKNNYGTIYYLDSNYFYDELKKLMSIHSPDYILKEITDIENSFSNHSREREVYMDRLSQELQDLLHFFQNLSVLRDKRKAANCILVTWIKRLLQEIGKQLDIPLELLELMAHWEIDELVKDRNSFVDKLKKRKDGFSVISSDRHGCLFFEGKKAKELKKNLEEQIMKGSSELVGRVAFSGKVEGCVKVINKVEDFSKFEEGDILVSSMTRPEFVPIMEKASAIVTDEGGITCHAAIVSRELGVPCIVGVEIATKVLKDGDKVIVDAEKGIVKRLE